MQRVIEYTPHILCLTTQNFQRMKKRYFFFMLTIGLLAGCSESWQTDVQTPVCTEVSPHSEFVIPIEQALASLEEVLVDINLQRAQMGLPKLKITERTECIAVNSTYLAMSRMLRTPGTASNNTKDTSLYIVNFPNNTGYAILSADKRIPDEVLLVADAGNLTLDELRQKFSLDEMCHIEGSNVVKTSQGYWNTEDKDYYVGGANPTFAYELVMKNTIVTPNDFKEINEPKIYYERKPWKTISCIEPMVKVAWHQRAPYNNTCPICCICGKRKPAGCVNIAVAQILSANKTVKTLDGVTINWEDETINKWYPSTATDSANIAHWVRFIGKKCCTFYGSLCGAGGKDYGLATPAAARDFFKNYANYKNVAKVSKYDSVLVQSMLMNHKPVFISAFSAPFSAHAWVIDGNLKQKQIVNKRKISDNSLISTFEVTREFIHCNFGWQDLSANGYYVSGVFNTTRGGLNTNSNILPPSKEEDEVFDYNYRIITYDL